MPKPPKKCMKCQKMAMPDSIYCTTHAATGRLPRSPRQHVPRGSRGQRGRIDSLDAGKITGGTIRAKDIESRAEYRPIKFSDLHLPKYYVENLKKQYPGLFK